MRGSWTALRRGWLAALGIGLSCLVSCGGQEFSSNDSGGSAGTRAGTSNGGKQANGGSSGSGSAGDEASGGSPDTGGSAGSGGGMSSGCNCAPGHYCRDGSIDCFDCAELSRLRFSAPERLDTLSASNQSSRFPRVGETNTDLLYAVEGLGIRYTTDSSTSAGNLVMQSLPQDTGPLLLTEQVTSLPAAQVPFNFGFDRAVEMGKRKLIFGVWQAGTLVASGVAPAPYNGGGANDHSLAIASPTADGVARAYWMSDRDANLGLVLITALLSAAPGGGPVNLDVGQVSCAPDKSDLTPWVTPDGKTLLFSNTRVDGNCTSTNQGKDIYTALLQPQSGQPTAPAVALPDVNSPANDVDPSLSVDFCELYFASDRDGDYALYRSHRR